MHLCGNQSMMYIECAPINPYTILYNVHNVMYSSPPKHNWSESIYEPPTLWTTPQCIARRKSRFVSPHRSHPLCVWRRNRLAAICTARVRNPGRMDVLRGHITSASVAFRSGSNAQSIICQTCEHNVDEKSRAFLVKRPTYRHANMDVYL